VRPWIVIAAFDEAAAIGRIVAAARRHAPVLVVDDGSADASAALAEAAGAEVVRHARRLGKGQALRTGLAAVRRRGASHMVTMDGDGQHAPDDLPAMLAAARRAPAAIVVGDRIADGRACMPAGRLNAIQVAGFFVNWASGLRVDDTQCGFRVYPIAALDEARARRGGFVFETEVLVAAAMSGIAVVQVPVTVIPRAGRRSRFRPLADGVAIALYLAGPVLRRWRLEVRAAAGEVAALVDRRRVRARHEAMLQAGAPYVGSPVWGAALGGAALHRAAARLERWWRHPRRRRAAVAASATLTAPLVLACAAVQTAGGRRAPDMASALVQRFYSQERLDDLGTDAGTTAAGGREQPAAAGVPSPELS
jgi:hypothetical protein